MAFFRRQIGLSGVDDPWFDYTFGSMLTNRQRTSLLPPDRKDPARYVWKGKTSDQRIDEMAELPQQGEDVQLLDPTPLERLVDFGYGFGWHLRQDILAIRTVVLRDACVVGFKLQHSFGDANGIVLFDGIFSESC